MSLRTQAVSIVRLLAFCMLAAGSSQAIAQTSETPSLTAPGFSGFAHVGEAMGALATVSTTSNLITGGNITFTVLDSAKSLIIDIPCSSVPVAPTGTMSASASCGFNAPVTAGSYYLRMQYSGAGGVNAQVIDEPFTVARYFTNITYTGIDNVFSPAEPVGVTKNIVATVASSGPTPTGNVTFAVKTSPSGTPSNVCGSPFGSPVPLDPSGQATCPVTFTTPGYYEVLISYGGDAANEPSGPVNPFIQIGHTVVNTLDSGAGSLRNAIDAMNLNCASTTEVVFAIPGPGPHTISPGSQLPATTCSDVTLDGTSQPGWAPNTSGFGGINASLQVIIAGGGCTTSGCNGLVLQGGGLVRGFAIHSFSAGAAIAGSGFTQVTGNYIGTDPGGNTALGNGVGIDVNGSAQIGGAFADSNLIVNSVSDGVRVNASSNAAIENNLIGGLTNGGAGNGNGTGVRFASGSNGVVMSNAIRYNSGAGVVVPSGAAAPMLDNAMYDNGGPGIDLNDDGASGNDEAGPPYDGDSGGNNLQNYPTITSVVVSGSNRIVNGYLKTNAPNTYTDVTIELYSNGVARSTATGGDNLVHAFSLGLDANGMGTFSEIVTGPYDHISATATVDSCPPPSITAPEPELKRARGAKGAKFLGGGCPVTSEYSPTVAAAALGPAITLDVPSLTFTASAGTMAAPQAVKITNSGNAPLTFGVPAFAVPTDYTATSDCPVPPAALAVSASCLATIVFTAPATPGTQTQGIAILSDAVSPVSITVTGVSTAIPLLAMAPASLAFGSQDVGTASAVQTLTLSNPSSSAVTITSVAASGDFAMLSNCPASLPKGTSCTIDVKFAPTAAGPRNGAVSVVADVTYSAPLSGTGTLPPAPGIGVVPTSLVFANRTLGTTSPVQKVTVTNTGTAPLAISGITTSGDFGSVSACPAVLAVGVSCDISVKFTPLVTGPRTGSLVIVTNAAGSPTTVALSGIGVDITVGTLDISPTAIDFLTQPVNVASGPAVVTVTNVGTATVHIVDLTLSGDFSLTDPPGGSTPCGGPLAANASCVFAVVFTPSAAGVREGSMTIHSDGSNPAATVLLGGFGEQGAAQRALRLPSTLTFAPQPFGTRSDAQAITVTNASAGLVSVSDIVATGDFGLVEDCSTIPAGGSCTLLVTFLPTARGDRSGTLTVRIASESQPYLVALGGLGVANPVPILSVTPTFVAYGNTFVGSVSDPASIVLTNVGEAELRLDAITAPGDFILESHCGTTLAAGASCGLDVRFFPRMLDSRGGSLEIRSNAAGSPHFVALSGTGCSIPNVGRSRIPQLLCGP